MIENEQEIDKNMKNETVEMEKDDINDINDDRHKYSFKKMLVFFKKWSWLLTSILLLVAILIICINFSRQDSSQVDTGLTVTTSPPSNLAEQGEIVMHNASEFM